MTARVELVADSGPGVGLGHVGRLAALGEQLGDAATFLVEDSEARGWLTRRFLRTAVPGILPGESDADVVVLDRVGPVAPEEVADLQRRGAVVALVDDMGPARAVADLVIDPPTLAQWPPAAGAALQGFAHTLLRREWSAARNLDVPREHVLLSFGGTDPYGLSEPAAAAMTGLAVPVVTVLGAGASARPAGSVLRDPPGFARLVRASQLLVTAFGITVLEAACVGTPVIAVCTRDDHLRDGRGLEAYGFVRAVDARAGITADEWRQIVSSALGDASWRQEVERLGPELVDGRGASRVCSALLASVRSPDSAVHEHGSGDR